MHPDDYEWYRWKYYEQRWVRSGIEGEDGLEEISRKDAFLEMM